MSTDTPGLATTVQTSRRGDTNIQQRWLNLQCEILQGTTYGVLYKASPEFSHAEIEASWPPGLSPPDVLRNVLACAKHENLFREDLPATADNGKTLRFYKPITVGEQRLVLVLAVDDRSDSARKSMINMLRWNSEWLKFALLSVPRSGKQSVATSFSIAVSALEQTGFKATATTLVTELSGRFECHRASLGFCKGRRTRVNILSHSARFKQESNLIQEIGSAMDEAVDQDCTVTYPALQQGSTVITHAHKRLVKHAGGGSVCTIPLSEGGRIIGALCLEREAPLSFDAAELEQIDQVLAIVTPPLWLRMEQERALPVIIGSRLKILVSRLFGPAYIRAKIAALAVSALLVFGYFAHGDWRITADAVVEGRVQRTIAAPIDGYISSSDARPGDRVSSGQLIGALDDSDLRLERLKWSTLRQQMISELREARAQNSRAEVSIITAKIEQADAELELVDEKLARTRLKAPFDGVVIEGDLSQLLGTPVQRGDLLFKIAPLDDYRIVLLVDEQDVAAVKTDMRGRLVLASAPGQVVDIVVTRVTPVSSAGGGRNYFRVEAKPGVTDLRLQPGMEGVGKVTVGEARLVWVWSRGLLNWLRLQTWTWWR
ncbi:MAG: HlyD family efflux transporter periplasmic adaptor subunit [Congregibacter sp.]